MRRTLAALASAALLAGCASNDYWYNWWSYGGSEGWVDGRSAFIDANYAATDALVRAFPVGEWAKTPIIVATVVDVDNLDASSTMGRMITEQVASRLAQRGYQPYELKLRGNLFVRAPSGELLLSREVSRVAQQHNAPVVVVGTFGRARSTVYVGLKAVQVSDNRILAGNDYAIPITDNLRNTVRDSRYSGALPLYGSDYSRR
jgi:TolB-like protein